MNKFNTDTLYLHFSKPYKGASSMTVRAANFIIPSLLFAFLRTFMQLETHIEKLKIYT